MTLAYIVTEGQFDQEILEKLLPKPLLQETAIIAAGGKYAAQSLASTILPIKQLPVALVIDGDTQDEHRIREQADLLNQLLYQSSPGIPFRVFIAVPALEVIFLEYPSVIEKIAERSFSDIELQLAKSNPRQFLSNILGEPPTFIHKILTNLTE